MTRTHAVTAALAGLVTAVATAGCAGTVRTPTTTLAGDSAGSTPLKAVPPGPTASQQVFADVTGQGHLRWDRAEPFQTLYASVPTPGAAIFTSDDGMCTLGPELRSADGLAAGYASAGHCDPDTGDRMQFLNSSADQQLVPLAAMSDVEDDDRGIDSGAIWTDVSGRATIAGEWVVAGVLTRDGIEALPLGTPICRAGAISGVDCGGRMTSDPHSRLRFAVESIEGDSGAPVFVVDAGTGYATLLGILERGNSATTSATLLDPALARLGATTVVDPAAAEAVAGHLGYSTRVTPMS